MEFKKAIMITCHKKKNVARNATDFAFTTATIQSAAH